MPRARTAQRKLANATRRAVRHPSWLRETVRTKLRTRADRDRRFSLADHATNLSSVAEALADAFGVTSEEYDALKARVRIPAPPEGAVWGGGEDILHLTGSVILLRRPSVVLETGVAMGFSTAVILAAMEENGTGSLHSIDLPPLQVEPDRFVGEVVPRDLRGRWTLHVGPSRILLPKLVRELAPIDLFIHDSDHSYAGQYEEYRRAWPSLAPGGCFISDDVGNPAFTDFAAEVRERPYLIAPPHQAAAVGLLVKAR